MPFSASNFFWLEGWKFKKKKRLHFLAKLIYEPKLPGWARLKKPDEKLRIANKSEQDENEKECVQMFK